MIGISKKENCCGCGACAQVCPKWCITMKPDEEGFLYPAVNQHLCVNCGLCEKVCPILNKKSDETGPVAAFAAYTKDADVREASSSGGIFSVLAQQILDQKGVVFGAAFAEDFSVHHVMIERGEDLNLLRGSKYVQSQIENTYQEARQVLQKGRPVLFSGVACQIAGLKEFLGKEYDNLYTVDVLCHGVPSPKVWSRYVRERELQSNAKTVSAAFRSKRQGWKQYSMEFAFENGAQYAQVLSQDTYMRSFLSNICLRPSCHSCRFKDIPRVSDLTIGDAWGIQHHMPHMDDDRGTSVVLVHSEKGSRLWAEVAPQLHVQQGQLDVLLPPTADSRKSVKKHPNRARFFAALDRDADMDALVKLTKKPFLRRILSAGKKCWKRLKRSH